MNLKKNSKGQLMTITVLVFVLLMVSALLLFVIVNISYDNIFQSVTLKSSSTDYGLILQRSADAFAKGSGTAALKTLFEYEYNASMRHANLISNFSEFMQYLIVNGTLPNVPANTPDANAILAMMSNSTLRYYNIDVSALVGIGSSEVTVKETKPIISQQYPYSISIQYNEYVSLNTSSGIFSFAIPVNASVPINNTPDLFYAQQGIYKPVSFGSIDSLATIVGNSYANSGNTSSFSYGTAYVIPSPSSCSISGIPSALNSPPYSSSLIIVTSNAFSITAPGCNLLDGYAGLITQEVDIPPAVPYLVFPSSSNTLSYIQTGGRYLLYGPSLDVLNISGLVSAASSGKYFTSPFAPSFSQMAQGDLQGQSQAGIFTLFGLNRQAADFNGATSQITTSEQQSNVVGYTVAAWVYEGSMAGGTIVSDRAPSGSGDGIVLGVGSQGNPAPPGSFFFGVNSNFLAIGVNTLGQFASGHWYFVVGTFNGISGQPVTSSDFNIFINGEPAASTSWYNSGSVDAPLTGASTGVEIGAGAFGNFNGSLANIQIYNSTLSASQILQLYEQGIEALPATNSELLGWYSLNGNANDYSGQQTSSASGVAYSLISGYTRDSILPAQYSQITYPIPGIDNCNNEIECLNYSMPHAFMGDSPLGLNSAQLYAAYFSGSNTYFEQGSGYKFMESNSLQPFSLSIWVYPESSNGVIVAESGASGASASWYDSWLNLADGEVYMRVWNLACDSLGSIPLNQWSNIAMTYSGSAVYGYINGQLVGQMTGSRSTPSTYSNNGGFSDSMFYPLGYIKGTVCQAGGGTTGTGPGFTGMMANYQFYSSQLTLPQVNSIYSAGIGASPIYAANIVSWWPLNGNLNDYTTLGNTGVSNGLSFVSISSNATNPASSDSSNSIGLSSLTVSSGEWAALGFGASSLNPVAWNVTAWNLSSTTTASIPYSNANQNPIDPSGTYPFQDGTFFTGIPNGDQSWDFGTAAYRGAASKSAQAYYSNFFGTGLAVPYPYGVNTLNSDVGCASGSYNTTGFTALTTTEMSGTYSFQEALDDNMEVWYRDYGQTQNWAPVFSPANENPWTYQTPQNRQPVNVSFAPGSYQLAVDQENICGAGMSSLSIRKYTSVPWAVQAWGYSIPSGSDSLAFSTVFPTPYNPLSPSGASLQQSGMWFGGATGGPQKWAYATPSEQYTSTSPNTYFGLPAVPFPSSVSDLNTQMSCATPTTAEIYDAYATMYLSGTYYFNVEVDDQMALFYRPVGGSWTLITSAPWPASGQGPTSYGPYSITVSPGEYQIAVDWSNICNAGTSAFQMYP